MDLKGNEYRRRMAMVSANAYGMMRALLVGYHDNQKVPYGLTERDYKELLAILDVLIEKEEAVIYEREESENEDA